MHEGAGTSALSVPLLDSGLMFQIATNEEKKKKLATHKQREQDVRIRTQLIWSSTRSGQTRPGVSNLRHAAPTAAPIFFIVFARPAPPHCVEHASIYTYLTALRLHLDYRCYQITITGPSGRAVEGVGVRPLAC